MYKFTSQPIRLGISACLLGDKVRFDGGHKRSAYCTGELAAHVEFVRICPEMAIGLGAPRPGIRQVQTDDGIRIQTVDGTRDVTTPLQRYCDDKVEALHNISGYILCAKSPTCGMERVMVYKPGSHHGSKRGQGLLAAALKRRWPQLPIEEEGRLHDAGLRENFFTRVYAHHDWQQLCQSGLTRQKLTHFHARYKYLLLAHCPRLYRQLGPLLADGGSAVDDIASRYFVMFMSALQHQASRSNHTSALQHIQGYFKKCLSPAQKAELGQTIMDFRQGLKPLWVPLTLINHYLREFPSPYIAQQVYLNPHPQELKLRYAY
ncbi:YbgA family protein [Shewanella sp. YIC-542]|uniref:YbgA family protein n=1 Tax=Shewanella mytili TaxID=3377111 RepID=UPI00398E985F